MAIKQLCDMLDNLNRTLVECGFDAPLVLKNEYFTITGKELIMKIPLTLTIKIPKESLGSNDAISQAISQAVRPTHPQPESQVAER